MQGGQRLGGVPGCGCMDALAWNCTAELACRMGRVLRQGRCTQHLGVFSSLQALLCMPSVSV